MTPAECAAWLQGAQAMFDTLAQQAATPARMPTAGLAPSGPVSVPPGPAQAVQTGISPATMTVTINAADLPPELRAAILANPDAYWQNGGLR